MTHTGTGAMKTTPVSALIVFTSIRALVNLQSFGNSASSSSMTCCRPAVSWSALDPPPPGASGFLVGACSTQGLVTKLLTVKSFVRWPPELTMKLLALVVLTTKTRLCPVLEQSFGEVFVTEQTLVAGSREPTQVEGW